jgi:hypothetical protein
MLSRKLSLATDSQGSRLRRRRQLLSGDTFVHTAGCVDPSCSSCALARATHGQGYTAMTQTGISWRDWWPSLAPSTGYVNRWSRIFCNKWRDGATHGLGSHDCWHLRYCTIPYVPAVERAPTVLFPSSRDSWRLRSRHSSHSWRLWRLMAPTALYLSSRDSWRLRRRHSSQDCTPPCI